MNNEKVLERMKQYHQVAKDASIYSEYILNEGVLLQVMECSKYDGFMTNHKNTHEVKALVQSKYRTYDDPVDLANGGEGWGMEEGEFYDKETIHIPSWLVEQSHLEVNLLNLLKYKFEKDIKKELKEIKDEKEGAERKLMSCKRRESLCETLIERVDNFSGTDQDLMDFYMNTLEG